MLHNKRGHDSERPAHHDEEWPPLAAAGESPLTETKTQHSNQSINQSIFKKKKKDSNSKQFRQKEKLHWITKIKKELKTEKVAKIGGTTVLQENLEPGIKF